MVTDFGIDEDDSCPPDLESVDQVPYHQDSRSTGQGPILGFAPDNQVLRNLAIAIRVRHLFFIELNCAQGTIPTLCQQRDWLGEVRQMAISADVLYYLC